MPSDLTLKAMNALHRSVLALTGGRLGWRAGSMPVLKLTTTGRKSGQQRSVLLTSPLQVGSAFLVVASRGGDDQHPAWFLNLRDHPEVDITVQGMAPERRIARIATAEERDTYWPQVTARYRNYADYQTRTDRQIPLVFLELPA